MCMNSRPFRNDDPCAPKMDGEVSEPPGPPESGAAEHVPTATGFVVDDGGEGLSSSPLHRALDSLAPREPVTGERQGLAAETWATKTVKTERPEHPFYYIEDPHMLARLMVGHRGQHSHTRTCHGSFTCRGRDL